MKRNHSIQFLGALSDEKLTRNIHIHLIENKIGKYHYFVKSKNIMNQHGLQTLYYLEIYGNIIWQSTN